MSVKAVIFDKDDTIIDLEKFWYLPVKETAKYVAVLCDRSADRELLSLLEAAAGFENGHLIPESPVVAGTNLDVVKGFMRVLAKKGIVAEDDFVEAVLKYLADACMKYGNPVQNGPFDTVLKQLKKQGYLLGIATSDDLAPTQHCLKSLGILEDFDMIMAADMVKRPKPFTDMGMAFAERFGVNMEEIVMVGDSDNDMKFAANCGMKGILYRKSQPDKLPEGADFYTENLEELPKLLEKM